MALSEFMLIVFVIIGIVHSLVAFFKFEKDVPFNTTNLSPVMNISCEFKLFNAVNCLLIPGYVLVDTDKGDLYKRSVCVSSGGHLINNVLLALDGKRDEQPLQQYFPSVLMVTTDGPEREITVGSFTSNKTQNTPIKVKNPILSITYDRETERVIWSEESGVFSKALRYSSTKRVLDNYGKDVLIIYKDFLYFWSRRSNVNIFKKLKSGQRSTQRWYKWKGGIKSVDANGNIMCCIVQVQANTFVCAKFPSNKIIFEHTLSHKVDDIAVGIWLKSYQFVITSQGSTKTYTMMYDLSTSKILCNYTTYLPGHSITSMKIKDSHLIYSLIGSNKVEARKFYSNCSLGNVVASTEYPGDVNMKQSSYVEFTLM